MRETRCNLRSHTKSRAQVTDVKGYKEPHTFPVALSWNLSATSWVNKVITYLQSLGGPGTTEGVAPVTHMYPGISQKQKLRDEELEACNKSSLGVERGSRCLIEPQEQLQKGIKKTVLSIILK